MKKLIALIIISKLAVLFSKFRIFSDSYHRIQNPIQVG